MVEDVAFPRDIRIDESLREEYNRFVNRSTSPFYGVEQSDLLVLAAAVGWDARRRVKSENRYVLFGRSALSDRQEWILRSIAIAEWNGVEILNNGRETTRIAEEYANGGMRELVELRQGPKNIVRELSNRMIKVANELEDLTQ